MRVVEVIRTGSSMPMVCELENNDKKFVKLKGAGEGITASIIEWVANHIGYSLGLPVLKPELIEINENANITLLDDEGEELWLKSKGLNLAFPYIHSESRHSYFSNEVKENLFLLDCFLMNVDRYELNENLIYGEKETFAADFGASLLIRGMLDGNNYINDKTILLLKRNPFYTVSADVLKFKQRLRDISYQKILHITESLPAEWVTQSKINVEQFTMSLNERFLDESYIHHIYDIVKLNDQIPLPDRKEQVRRNRDEFIKRMESKKK